MSATFLIVDNRCIVTSSFVDDTFMASFNASVEMLLTRYFVSTKEHPKWMSLVGVGTAAGSATVKMLGERYLTLPTILHALAPTHQCVGTPSTVAADTWSLFLPDGLAKVQSMLKDAQPQLTGRVIVYSTVFHLFGGNDVDPFTSVSTGAGMDQRVNVFCDAVLRLLAQQQ